MGFKKQNTTIGFSLQGRIVSFCYALKELEQRSLSGIFRMMLVQHFEGIRNFTRRNLTEALKEIQDLEENVPVVVSIPVDMESRIRKESHKRDIKPSQFFTEIINQQITNARNIKD